MKDIEIEQYCDGWAVKVDSKRFRWDHNDEDMGTKGIKSICTLVIMRMNGMMDIVLLAHWPGMRMIPNRLCGTG